MVTKVSCTTDLLKQFTSSAVVHAMVLISMVSAGILCSVTCKLSLALSFTRVVCLRANLAKLLPKPLLRNEDLHFVEP